MGEAAIQRTSITKEPRGQKTGQVPEVLTRRLSELYTNLAYGELIILLEL
jgi:hypothetical protein